tara:strand:- start:155 stop:1231 length:1077 start_codon:yes stop_codon:yes gene_type:complete
MGEVLTNSQIGGRRNIIINGAMNVAQRATSSTGLGASTGYFTVDRIQSGHSGNSAGRYTMTQEAITDLGGFNNALKLACTTADTSIASNEWEYLAYHIEAQDLQALKFGTSDAEKFTLSFFVKGNASATYTLGAYLHDSNRWMAQTFSVTTSFTKVSLTWEADTSGTINDDTGLGLSFYITLQAGSDRTSGSIPSTWETLATADIADSSQTQFFDSTSRTLFITGLQMEVGSVVTPFEHRSFAEEVALCKRYYEVDGHGSNNPNGWNFKSMPVKLAQVGNYIQGTKFAVEKRADPTIVVYSRNGTSGKVSVFATGSDAANNWSTNAQGVTGFHAVVRDGGTHTVGTGFEYGFTADAEL